MIIIIVIIMGSSINDISHDTGHSLIIMIEVSLSYL